MDRPASHSSKDSSSKEPSSSEKNDRKIIIDEHNDSYQEDEEYFKITLTVPHEAEKKLAYWLNKRKELQKWLEEDESKPEYVKLKEAYNRYRALGLSKEDKQRYAEEHPQILQF